MEYISRYYHRSGGGSADAAAGGRTALAAAAKPPSPPSHQGTAHHRHDADSADKYGRPDVEGKRGDNSSPRSDPMRFDPWKRYRELEEELFKLKFERAHMLEEEDETALKDRRDREEADVLRERLRELKVEIRGERRTEVGDDGEGTEEQAGKEGDHHGEDGDTIEGVVSSSPSPARGGSGMHSEDGGLRRRRDKMDTNVRRLKRDVDILRADVESVQSNADRIESDLDTAQREFDRVLAQYNNMESKGEDLNNEVDRLQSSARQAARDRVEVTIQKETADDGAAQLRGKCEALRVQLAQLQDQITAGGDDARNFRTDAEKNRKTNERMRDKMLMTTNPEEYRKRKAEERKRKKLEGKLEGRRATSERGGKDMIGAWLSRSVKAAAKQNVAGDLAGHHDRSVDSRSGVVDLEEEKSEEDHDDGESVASGRYTVA